MVSSRLLYPEARSAVARAGRSERLSSARLSAVRAGVERLWEDVDAIDVSDDLARRAGDLAEDHGLRAYDAVHLASALAVADAETVLVAADRALVDAARALELSTAAL